MLRRISSTPFCIAASTLGGFAPSARFTSTTTAGSSSSSPKTPIAEVEDDNPEKPPFTVNVNTSVSQRVEAEKADKLLGMRISQKQETFNKLKPEHTATFKDMRPLPSEKECIEDLRRRLIFQSRYRGMVEMDVIFGLFAKTRLPSMDRQGLIEYDQLLRQLDNDLFNWLVMGFDAPEEVNKIPLFQELKRFMVDHKEDIVAERL